MEVDPLPLAQAAGPNAEALVAVAHALELLVRMMSGALFPGWMILLAPLFEALLWPVVSVLLLGTYILIRRMSRSTREIGEAFENKSEEAEQ